MARFEKILPALGFGAAATAWFATWPWGFEALRAPVPSVGQGSAAGAGPLGSLISSDWVLSQTGWWIGAIALGALSVLLVIWLVTHTGRLWPALAAGLVFATDPLVLAGRVDPRNAWMACLATLGVALGLLVLRHDAITRWLGLSVTGLACLLALPFALIGLPILFAALPFLKRTGRVAPIAVIVPGAAFAFSFSETTRFLALGDSPLDLAVRVVPLILLGISACNRCKEPITPLLLAGGLLFSSLIVAASADAARAGGLPLGFAIAACVGLLLARTSRKRVSLVSIAAVALLVLFGVRTSKQDAMNLEPVRHEVHRLLEAHDRLPPREDPGIECILGLRPTTAASLPLDLSDVELTTDLTDPGPGRVLRVLSWMPPSPLLAKDRHAYVLKPHFYALRPRSDELRLEAPHNASVLPCRGPQDEPVFTFSVPLARDPGAAAFSIAFSRDPEHPSVQRPLLLRQLDASVLKRTVIGDRVHYAWRPSVRSSVTTEPELLWEYGDLAPKNTTFHWTVVARLSNGVVIMAPPAMTKSE